MACVFAVLVDATVGRDAEEPRPNRRLVTAQTLIVYELGEGEIQLKPDKLYNIRSCFVAQSCPDITRK